MKYILLCYIALSCFIAPVKSKAFDYKSYTKQLHQIRSLTPVETTITPTNNRRKKAKSTVIKEITKKLLEALDSDLIPAKIFNANNKFSIYLKPAKISKLGLKYKF